MIKIILLSICLFFVLDIQAQVITYPNLTGAKRRLKSSTLPAPVQKITLPNSNSTPNGRDENRNPAQWPFQHAPHQQTFGHQNCNHNDGHCDPRNLPLSPNGKLLSVEGHEVDFRTSGNPDVTNICGTPRGYIDDNSKSATCSFTVPCDNPSNRDAANTSVKYFQLVWHVMRSTTGGATSNINQARIDALMAELNADYATHNMIFCAGPANFYVDDVNYTHDSNTEEVSLKTTYNVTPTQVINIYVVGTMSAGGYARFPYDPMGGTSATGGIVLNRGNCNVGTHTLAHEMGHTFGLEHTFAGVDERGQCSNCYERVRNVNGSSNTSGAPTPFGGPYNTEGDREGDWCSDTHPHDTYSYNCSTSSNSNGGCDSDPWANAPVNNHMSYSFCSSQFTTQQSNRMHCMVNSYLTSWTSYGGGICGAQPPVADFDASPTSWIAPSNVTFNDLSTPQVIITSWTWVFDVAASGTVTCAGCVGANATYVGQNPPVVTYPNTGLYTVSLTITSANGNDTETKVDYIEVTAPAGDCDILDTDWLTPAPTVTAYSGTFGYFTGVPSEGSNLPIDPAGYYQQYFTPVPGTSIVGAVTVALGLLVDPDDDMDIQIVVYEDDPGNPGFPNWGAGPVAFEIYSPTQLGVPTGLAYQVFTIPLECAPTIMGATFHVGVEMFPGDATDELVLLSNVNGQGGSPLTNTYTTSFCGDGDFNVAPVMCGYAAVNFDLYCYPVMGWYTPLPLALGYIENVDCDTTHIDILTTTLYDGFGCAAPSGPNTGMVNWTYTFGDGTTYSSTTEIPVLSRKYTSPGIETLTIMALNDCGRADTTVWTIPYNFMSTPDADFTKNPQNPICMGAPGVTFTANTSGYANYTWDFGDGSAPVSSSSSTASHTYATPGLYYVQLDVTSLGYQPSDTFYLETFAAGFPAGYRRLDLDPFTPAAPFVNPPFTGTNATAWLVFDVDGSGDNEAVSTSWNSVPGAAYDWMITSGIGVLPANQMLSWDAEAMDATFADGYEVRISTTGQLPATVANFNTLLLSVPAENAYKTTRSVNLSAYAGQTVYIAFINNSFDDYLLSIDNIRVGTIGAGCTNSEQKLDFVEIIDCTIIPPTTDFGAAPMTGCAPLEVTFSDNTVVGDAPTSWVWNFGDGQFSTDQNPPAHTYTAAGSYFVIFQSCNSGGCTLDTMTIVVGDVTVANAGPDQNICGDATTLAGNDPAPYTGVWSVVSGSGTFTTPAAYNTTVTALGGGTNVFRWSITGTDGCVSTEDVTIEGKNFVYGLNGATSNTYCTDASGWHHFYSGSEILLSIQGDLTGAPVGFPSITIADNGTWYQETEGPFTAPSCVSGLTPGEERFEMERSWDVDFGGGTLNPPYDVRFYYQPAERTSIETAAANWITTYPACSYTYKYPTPLGFYWFKNTGAPYAAPLYDGTHLTGAIGAVSGINYTEMTGITSFSGGSGAIILVPDPLLVSDWLYFDGVTDNKINYLRWATASEQNSSHFNLQRSKNGIDFQTIGTIAAEGNSTTTQQYNYDDVNPFSGENYYRLELVDVDGTPTYSNTVLLFISNNNLGYAFYPNPTNNVVHYQYEASKAESLEFEVIDILGRVLQTFKATSVVGINNIPVNLSEYPVGSYMVRVYNKTTGAVHSSKIIKSER